MLRAMTAYRNKFLRIAIAKLIIYNNKKENFLGSTEAKEGLWLQQTIDDQGSTVYGQVIGPATFFNSTPSTTMNQSSPSMYGGC